MYGIQRGLGTNLLWWAILIYLACEFLAKKKTFPVNIFNFLLKGEPISKFWGPANQNTYHKFVKYDLRRLCLLEIFHVPIPPGNFYLLTPQPPRNFHWQSVGGGMDIFWNHTFHTVQGGFSFLLRLLLHLGQLVDSWFLYNPSLWNKVLSKPWNNSVWQRFNLQLFTFELCSQHLNIQQLHSSGDLFRSFASGMSSSVRQTEAEIFLLSSEGSTILNKNNVVLLIWACITTGKAKHQVILKKSYSWQHSYKWEGHLIAEFILETGNRLRRETHHKTKNSSNVNLVCDEFPDSIYLSNFPSQTDEKVGQETHQRWKSVLNSY